MSRDKLTEALLNRDFDQAQSAIGDWGAKVMFALKACPGEAERRRVFEDARSFAEEHLYLARIVRSHIATELQANSASFLYADSELKQPRWRLRG